MTTTKQPLFNWQSEWPLLVMMTGVSLLAIFFYRHFPETVPSHWNFSGEVDGWSGKASAAFLIPGVLWGLYLLFMVLPKIDPRGQGYLQFKRAYRLLRAVLLVFLSAVYIVVSLVGLGYDLAVSTYVPLGAGLLLVVIGRFLPQLKSNWFVGIRTPWTLSSEENWRRTHLFGSKMFMLAGVLIAVSPWLPSGWQVGVFISAITLMAVVTCGYSYVIYRQGR